jgi:hypothetical protein
LRIAQHEEANDEATQMTETNMTEVEFPKRARAPRELESRPVPHDYRPKQLRMGPVLRAEDEHAAETTLRPPMSLDGEAVPESAVILRKLEAELGRRPLEEIARLVRSLTYGEMIELASSMSEVQPEGSVITADNLPNILYRWSTARVA